MYGEVGQYGTLYEHIVNLGRACEASELGSDSTSREHREADKNLLRVSLVSVEMALSESAAGGTTLSSDRLSGAVRSSPAQRQAESERPARRSRKGVSGNSWRSLSSRSKII